MGGKIYENIGSSLRTPGLHTGGGYDIMTADKGILSETALAITLKRTEPEVWRKEHRNGTLSIKIFFICCKI